MKEKIESVLKNSFINLNISEEFNIVSDSNRKELCDFQINTIFSLAKKEGKTPKEIGELLVSEINKLECFNTYFKDVSFVLPGFININVSDEFISKCLNNCIEKNYGIEKVYDETVFLDYGGPNIAKPLHIGHLRPAIIGESVKRILSLKGYNTISDAHFGDFGLQMGQVIYGIIRDKKNIKDINIEYLNVIYPEISKLSKENEEIAEECKRITKELQSNNSEYTEYLNKIIDVSLKDIKRLYGYLGVSFDLWLGERDSFNYVKPLIDLLNSKNLIHLSEGAYVVDVKRDTDTKEIPPLIVLKSDGATMYSTTDLATIYDRVHKYKIDHMLYFTDLRQEMHFEQVFRVSDMCGLFPYERFEHIKNGTINGPDNKPYKTRSGETVKLDELIKLTKEEFLSKREENKNLSEKDINIIVNSIIKYADLSNTRDKNYIFDLSKFSDVNGKTGPYILYTALRIKKILDDNSFVPQMISNKIYNEVDRNLRIKLVEFNKYLTLASNERMPHYLCEYLYDLCNLVNSFYQNNNIKNESDLEKKTEFLNILDYTYELIELVLKTLILEIPEVM